MMYVLIQVVCLFLIINCYAEKRSYEEMRAEKLEKFARKVDEQKERKKRLNAIIHRDHQEDSEEIVHEEAEAEEVRMSKHSKIVHKKERIKNSSSFYVAPSWPSHSFRFLGGDYIKMSVGYNNASKMYDDLGAEQSIVAQKFGQQKVTFGQLFIESKLLSDDLVEDITSPAKTPNKNDNPFYYLRDMEISLDGHSDRVEGVVSYARQFWNNRFVVGLRVPIVYQQNTLKYTLGVTDDMKIAINKKGLIQDNFSGDVDQFFRHLLVLRGFSPDQCFQAGQYSANKTGLGDVSCSMQWNVRNTEHHCIALGMHAVFPTSQNQDISVLWAPQLGGLGSPVFGGYVAAVLLKNEVVSPYFHGQIAVSPASNQILRVPEYIKYSGVMDKEIQAQVRSKIHSQYVGLIGLDKDGKKTNGGEGGKPIASYRSFEGYDAEIPAFAGSFRSVRIAPGVMFDVMVGNVFSPSFATGLTLDVFYALHIKSMSSVQENGYERSEWALEKLVEHSNRIDHKVGGQLAYQWQEYFRFSCGAGYSFAGRNNPAEIRAELGFSVDF